MPEITNNKNDRDDEIDLLDLFRRMGRTISRGFGALGRAFLISFIFMLKRWLPLGLSIAAGIGASFLLKSTTKSSFTSDMTLRSNAIATSEMISYVNRLHKFCMDRSATALSRAMNLDPQSVGNINDISAFWVIDNHKDGIPDYVDYKNNHSVYDTVNVRMQDRLDIRVKIKSPQELTLVRDGIIKFIESDSLFQQLNRVRLRQNHELLTRLDYDIVQLDSLQKVKYFEETRNMHPQSGGQMVFLQEQKTQLVYENIYTLYARKQGLESQRDLYKGVVTVLSEFSLPTRRVNGGSYYAIRIVPVLFLLTLLILILSANKKNLTEVFDKYK
ncbi:MAG: hypothetical protein WA816_06435 [Bacteroidales bacterium]